MAHDPPLPGQVLTAGRLAALDKQSTYTPTFAGDSATLDVGDGTVSGAWHRNGHRAQGWARFEIGASPTIPSGVVRISMPFDPDDTIMDVSSVTTGRTFTTGNGMVEGDTFDGIVYTRIVPNDVSGLMSGTHLVRCMEYNATNSLSWSVYTGSGQELTVNFAYIIDPASA